MSHESYGQLTLKARLSWMLGSEQLTGLPNSSLIQSRMRLTSSPSVGQSSCHFHRRLHRYNGSMGLRSSRVSISSILLTPTIVLAEKSWQNPCPLAVSNHGSHGRWLRKALSHNQVSRAPSPSRRKCQSNSSVQGGRAFIVCIPTMLKEANKFWRLFVLGDVGWPTSSGRAWCWHFDACCMKLRSMTSPFPNCRYWASCPWHSRPWNLRLIPAGKRYLFSSPFCDAERISKG